MRKHSSFSPRRRTSTIPKAELRYTARHQGGAPFELKATSDQQRAQGGDPSDTTKHMHGTKNLVSYPESIRLQDMLAG